MPAIEQETKINSEAIVAYIFNFFVIFVRGSDHLQLEFCPQMPETKKYPTLVWLDLEMTGLDPDSERIIEIAIAVTNHDLTEITEGPNLVISQPQEFIDNMD